MLAFALAALLAVATPQATPRPTPPPAPSPSVVSRAESFKILKAATGALYFQTDDGSMEFACTVTKIGETGLVRKLFLTAAHCVSRKVAGSRESEITDKPLFISMDDYEEKAFMRARLVDVGRVERGVDIAVLSVSTLRSIPSVEIGTFENEQDGDPVSYVSFPNGMGKQCLYGTIASTLNDRPMLVEGRHKWDGYASMQGISRPGSSGTAVVSIRTGKVVGVVAGFDNALAYFCPMDRIYRATAKDRIQLEN